MSTETLLWTLAGLALANLLLLLVLLLRRTSPSAAEAAERLLREELRAARTEAAEAARELRREVALGLRAGSEGMLSTLGEMGMLQRAQLEVVTRRLGELTQASEARLERLRATLEEQLRRLQERNEQKLEQMRATVDERLHQTLEQRLGESFKLVSERLEAVQQGLGEMKSLATGVGDLKRVLVNVKARGTWGEVQLGAILEQLLTPQQYDRNVATRSGSRESVEYAIRLPGPAGRTGETVWLPVDAKFPQEAYLRIQEAAERGDTEAVQRAESELARALRLAAREIADKYLDPPRTTDFALLFLPTEGLYAEALRRPGLVEELQQACRVVVAGPTTLAAILNSLRLGFRTLAIEQRASEVWQVLAAVKTEFGKFGGVLERVKKQLESASRTIDRTGVRTRAMERRLRDVESLPPDRAAGILGLAETPDVEQGSGAEEGSV